MHAQDGSTNSPQPVNRTEPRPYQLDNRLVRASAADFQSLREIALRDRYVQVIVGLQVLFTPEGWLDARAVQAQRDQIAAAAARMNETLAATGATVTRTYRSVPAVALRLPASALDVLQRSGLAASIRLNGLVGLALAKSSAAVESSEAAVLNRAGQGQFVAVLDTGVESSHPFLRQNPSGPSKVLYEACYSTGANCPNGTATQTGAGAAAPCGYSTNCDHGTHVAGIAVGRDNGGVGFNGIAREANLVAVNVFSNANGGLSAYWSDIIAGLQYVQTLATGSTPVPIASVNLSLGTGYNFSADCDANFSMEKAAIDNLRSIGIPTIIASGNNGNNQGISAPACISTAITVGASDANVLSSEYVAWFSNSSAQVELLAPGDSIQSSVPGGGYVKMSGTSMAAPHVAGAWAVMKQLAPTANVATIQSYLEQTGKPLTDSDNGITKPRIRVLSASVRIADTGFVDAETFTGNGSMGMVSNGMGLATRTGGSGSGSISITGIPTGSYIAAAYLYWMTLGGPDETILFQNTTLTGTLVGASQNTCWPGINPFGANRTYRAKLPLNLVPGNGSYSVSGLGSFGIDGQGASLVIVYQPQYLEFPATSRIIRLRHGAMTLNQVGNSMTHTFTGLSLPQPASAAELHVGIGDSDPFMWEDALLFNGTAILPKFSITGTDGAMWDDLTLNVPTTLLPAGTTTATNSLGLTLNTSAIGDCLCWSYAALSYKYKEPGFPIGLSSYSTQSK